MKFRSARGQRVEDTGRLLGDERGVWACEPKLAVPCGQEEVRAALVGIVHACLQLVLAEHLVPVVLRLPGVYNPPLGNIPARSKAQHAADVHIREPILDVPEIWLKRVAIVIAAEGNV